MDDVRGIGRALVVAGLALAAIGALLEWGPRPRWLGRLPGDWSWKGDGWAVYFPLATMLLVSAALSLLLWLFRRR